MTCYTVEHNGYRKKFKPSLMGISTEIFDFVDIAGAKLILTGGVCMGCFLTVTEKDVEQFKQSKRVVQDTGWKTVSSDRRYEEKIVKYKSGRSTRMTRVKGQPVDENGYPHNTEFYAADGKKDHYKDNSLWDGHFSQSEEGPRHGTHRTAQSILDDLGISIKTK